MEKKVYIVCKGLPEDSGRVINVSLSKDRAIGFVKTLFDKTGDHFSVFEVKEIYGLYWVMDRVLISNV